jgi:hypothetical protein
LRLATVVAVAAAALALTSGSSVRPAAGQFTITIGGPSAITLDPNAVPPRYGYDVTIRYVGPAVTSEYDATFTAHLPDQVNNPGMGAVNGPLTGCSFTLPTTPAPTISCTFPVNPNGPSQVSFSLESRPTAATGTGTLSISMSSGDSASYTTTFTRAAPPATTTTSTTTTPSTPPAATGTQSEPVAAPAAPAQSYTETFTSAGQAQAETATIAASAASAEINVTWSGNASFDVTSVTLGRRKAGRMLSATPVLKVAKHRSAHSLKLTLTGLSAGSLHFKVVARKVAGKTRVRVTVRQSKV